MHNIILRASSWVNQICKQRTLEATVNTETKEVSMNNHGLIRVHPNMFPVVALTEAKYRVSPIGDWIPMPLGYIQPFERYFTVYNLNSQSISPVLAQQFPAFGYYTPYRIRNLQRIPMTMRYTYVNGYANTQITESVGAGASSFTVANAIGIYEGQELTIYDNERTEQVVVASVEGKTVTVEDPLLETHYVGAAVSALPAAVRQATILLASYLIKERGSVAVVMDGTNVQGMNTMSKNKYDVELAKTLLAPFVRGVTS